MKTRTSRYQQLGIDAAKANVREIFGRIVRNDFPGAFVNIVRHPARRGVVFTKHGDGDGSKFVQRLLYFRETGDIGIIRGAVDDAFSMNTGDIASSGFVFGLWAITQFININGLNVPKDLIMEQIARRVKGLLALYRTVGFNLTYFLGGETADLPHQVNSAVYDVDIYAECGETEIIRGNIKPGDVIYGLASDGRAAWEREENSGIMANGLTLGRVCTMLPDYGIQYPYLIGHTNVYRGKYTVTDKPDILGGQTVSQALLSPTRQWAIVIRRLIEELKKDQAIHLLHGISMNTGGGATKIAHVGRGIVYQKKMPLPLPIFRFIKAESGETWRNMYQTFNCGVGLDIVGENDQIFRQALVRACLTTGVNKFELGVCRRSSSRKNRVILKTPFGSFDDY